MRTPRLRRLLQEIAARRTSRRNLVGIFVSILGLLVAAVFWWYLPHRPEVLLSRAIAKSLEQQGVAFTVSDSGSTATNFAAKVDKQGDSSIEFTKNGRPVTIINAGTETYFNGGDSQWFAVPQTSAQALLPGVTSVSGVQPAGLKAAERERLEDLYNQYGFIEVRLVFEEEVIARQMSYHYQVAVNGRQLHAFLKAVQRDIPTLKVQDNQIATILDASWLRRPLEVWVGKQDGLIRQITYAGAGSDTIRVTVEAYGGDIDVVRPQSSAPLLETLRR